MHAYKWRKWCCKWSHSSSVTSLNHLVRLQVEKWWAGALLSGKCCCFVQKRSCTQFWTGQSEQEEEREAFLPFRWLSGLVCSQCFFGPLGVLFIMKALKDERYTAIINSAIRATVHLCSFAESMYRLDNTILAMCTICISRYYQRFVEDSKPLGLRILCS